MHLSTWIRNAMACGMLAALWGLSAPTQADEKGNFLVLRVIKEMNAAQPLVCDYTVTFRYHGSAETYHCRSHVWGTRSGNASQRIRHDDALAFAQANVFLGTIDFIPLSFEVPGNVGGPTLEARYVGKQTVAGIPYEVVDVRQPVRETFGPSVLKEVTFRWFVGADNHIHRMTARVNPKDMNMLPQARGATASQRGKQASATPSSQTPITNTASGKPDKTNGEAQVQTSSAPDDRISIEAIALNLRKAIFFSPRPPTNPPLSPRAGLGLHASLRVAALSSNGALLATCHQAAGKTIHVYEAQTGELKHTLDDLQVPASLLQFSSDGRLLAGVGENANSVLLWDMQTGRLVQTLAMGNVSGLAFSPDSKRLAVAASGGAIVLWDISTGAKTQTLKQQNASSLLFAPDGRRLVSLEYPQTILMWDMESGKIIHSQNLLLGPMASLAFSPDGKYFAVAKVRPQQPENTPSNKATGSHLLDADRYSEHPNLVVICDGQTGEPLRELQGAMGMIIALAFINGGKSLLAVDIDQRGDIPTNHPGFALWNTANWQQTEGRELAGASYNGFNKPVIAPEARRVLLWDTGLSSDIWDLAETLPNAPASKP